MNNNVCIRRILAWIIDWNLSGIPCIIFSTLCFNPPSLQNMALVLIFLFLFIMYPVTFVLRDVIFKGRSVGKRIFGLHIVNKITNEKASVKQRVIRNLFFFAYAIDGIILIATNESIGDRIANTVVIKK